MPGGGARRDREVYRPGGERSGDYHGLLKRKTGERTHGINHRLRGA